LYRFRCPWPFEQGRFFNFMFRPVTDIVQFDSTISGTTSVAAGGPGLGFDDRIGTTRDQTVTVQVELLGERLMEPGVPASAWPTTNPGGRR
jgi:hypothetical protein